MTDRTPPIGRDQSSAATKRVCKHIKVRSIPWGVARTKEWCDKCKMFVQHEIDFTGHP